MKSKFCTDYYYVMHWFVFLTCADKRGLLLFSYANGSLDDVHTMLSHDETIIGLGDAGAHCGVSFY